MQLVLTLFWILASTVEGVRDGFLYHYKMFSIKQDTINLHPLFNIARAVVLSLMSLIYFLHYGIPSYEELISGLFSLLSLFIPFGSPFVFYEWFKFPIFILSLMAIFSFFHNGFYYLTRHKLNSNLYPKGFTDTSFTSTASIELNFKTRSILAGLGGIGILSLQFIN